MRCPHCQRSIDSPQLRWQRARLVAGDCVGCGGPKEHPGAWRCRRCQIKLNARQRRRYALKRKAQEISTC